MSPFLKSYTILMFFYIYEENRIQSFKNIHLFTLKQSVLMHIYISHAHSYIGNEIDSAMRQSVVNSQKYLSFTYKNDIVKIEQLSSLPHAWIYKLLLNRQYWWNIVNFVTTHMYVDVEYLLDIIINFMCMFSAVQIMYTMFWLKMLDPISLGHLFYEYSCINTFHSGSD